MTTEYIEKQHKVIIYYIKEPENYDYNEDRETQSFLDITVLGYTDELYLSGHIQEFKGYEMVHMEIIKADMVHLEALYQRFQENGNIRSMMIGDIIKINNKFFVVGSIGFEEIKLSHHSISSLNLL